MIYYRDPSDLFSFGDVDGKGTDAKLQHPLGVSFIPKDKTLIVADSYNHKLKLVRDLDQRAATCHTIPDISLNEPGGLALSGDGLTLYACDTNNHTIKAIQLNDYSIREIKPILPDLDCTDDGKPEDDKSDIHLPKKSGTFKLEILLKVLPDSKLNNEAPNSWKIALPSGWSNDEGLKGPIESNNLMQNIHYNFGENCNANDSMKVKLDIQAFLCNTENGTCYSRKITRAISCWNCVSNGSNDYCQYQISIDLV